MATETESGCVVKAAEALDVGCRLVQALCRLVIFFSCYCLLRGEPTAVLQLPKQQEAEIVAVFDVRVGLDYTGQQLLKLVDGGPSSVPLLMGLLALLVIAALLTSSALLCGSYAQAKEVLLYTTLLLALSPVIRSLAETVSTDTVYALSSLLSTLHLLVADYSPKKKHNEISGCSSSSSNNNNNNNSSSANGNGNGIIPQHSPLSTGVSVSLNSQILSSVCLASRLGSNGAVFCLMCAAALLFVVAAGASKAIASQRLLTLLHISGATFALATLETPTPVLAVWAGVLTAVGILLPLLFVHLQSLKQVASGPWDEAVPTIGGELQLGVLA